MTDLSERLQGGLADRYRLDRELERGGMATAYLAQDLKHDRKVALKVLRPDLAATLGPERFEREIRWTARLQHAHILPMLDSGEAAGQLRYRMPYLRGESLRERLRREVQLPVDVDMDLARQVALALDCAHCEGVIHRDLKPENILLSNGQAFIADAISLHLRHIPTPGQACPPIGYVQPDDLERGPSSWLHADA